MGFFSWKTCDTGETIWNMFTGEKHREIWLLLPNGKKFGGCYDGYGRILTKNGKTICILTEFGKSNGIKGKNKEHIRDQSINLMFGKEKPQFPLNLTFNPYETYNPNRLSESCETQGYFEWR